MRRRNKASQGWIEVPPGWYIDGWYTCKKTGKKRPILKRIGS